MTEMSYMHVVVTGCDIKADSSLRARSWRERVKAPQTVQDESLFYKAAQTPQDLNSMKGASPMDVNESLMSIQGSYIS